MFDRYFKYFRMVIDIVKFFFIYSLVLFSFACGSYDLRLFKKEKEILYLIPKDKVLH